VLTRRRLLQLLLAGIAVVAAQPLLPLPTSLADVAGPVPVGHVAQGLSRITGRHARRLFAVLALSPRGFSDGLLRAVLWPHVDAARGSQQLDASAYMIRRSLDDDRVVARTRAGYKLARRIPGFELLRSELQAQFVQLTLDEPGLLPPTRHKWVRRTLARGDAEGAASLVFASI
jgi:hypothetical protein